jgi:primosomal protein N'
MNGQCKYCGAEIDKACIRCSSCDYAWQDGREAGKEEIKSKLREIYNVFKNFVSV